MYNLWRGGGDEVEEVVERLKYHRRQRWGQRGEEDREREEGKIKQM